LILNNESSLYVHVSSLFIYIISKAIGALSVQYGEDIAILAFPSGEFGNQERATDAEVAVFANSVGFPKPPLGVLMSKGFVNGSKARASWVLMKAQTGAADPTWNFKGKFLVSKQGVISVPSADLKASVAALM